LLSELPYTSLKFLHLIYCTNSFSVIITDFIIAFLFTCSFMRAASLRLVCTVDTTKWSSRVRAISSTYFLFHCLI
jgi:hypothetical protein